MIGIGDGHDRRGIGWKGGSWTIVPIRKVITTDSAIQLLACWNGILNHHLAHIRYVTVYPNPPVDVVWIGLILGSPLGVALGLFIHLDPGQGVGWGPLEGKGLGNIIRRGIIPDHRHQEGDFLLLV